MTEAVNLYRPEYAAARMLAQNAVIDHALNPYAIKDIYVTLDYETGDIQIAFTDKNGVKDKPEFISIGHY